MFILFKGHASIKAEPKISAPELVYYDAGNTVNYDSLIQADGHYWFLIYHIQVHVVILRSVKF